MFDINHIANLARLRLAEEEAKKITADLQLILDYVEALKKVDTTDIEPILQICDAKNVVRRDEAGGVDLNTNPKILQLAPQSQGAQIKIKRILE